MVYYKNSLPEPIPNEFDFEKEFNYGIPQRVMDQINLKREVVKKLTSTYPPDESP
jgi:hypothetical protein